MKHKFFPANTTRGLALQTVKRIFYKDGEQIKSYNGVDLIQTFLVLDTKNQVSDLR